MESPVVRAGIRPALAKRPPGAVDRAGWKPALRWVDGLETHPTLGGQVGDPSYAMWAGWKPALPANLPLPTGPGPVHLSFYSVVWLNVSVLESERS